MTIMSAVKTESSIGRFLGIVYIAIFTFAAMYVPQPLLPSIRAAFPALSESTVSLLMTVTMVPLAIAPLIYGAFLSSLSSRKILVVALALLGGSGVLMGLSHDFIYLIVARTIQGLAIPAILTSLMVHISIKFSGAYLQRAMAIYIGATIIGGLSGRVLGGIVANYFDWNIAIIVINALTLIGVVPAMFLENQGKARFARVKIAEFLQIFKTPGIAKLMLVDGLGFFVFVALTNCLPFRLSEGQVEISELRIAVIYLGYGIGVFMAFGSRATIKLLGGEKNTIVAGMCIYLLSLPIFLISGSIAAFAGMCIVCAGQFMEHSVSPGLINRLTVHDKAAANGLYLSIYYAGGALGSYFPGFIYQSVGWTQFIFTLAFFILVAFFAAIKFKA